MASPLLEIQKALVAAINADTGVQATGITGVFDKAPQNQPGPYIVVGQATELPMDVFAKKGKESSVTIHIWSQFEGFEEALTVMVALDALLNYKTLTLNGHANIYTMYDFAQTLEDPDGIWRQAAVRYKIGTQEA